jgi:hypothetical protein
MESIILDLLQFDLGYTHPLFFIYFSDQVSPLPKAVKSRAIELVKEMIIGSRCRYWTASKLAINAIYEAEMNYEGSTCSSIMLSSCETTIFRD